MCMKNVNTNIVFADIRSNSEHTEVTLENVGKFFCVTQTQHMRIVPSLSFALFISALGEKNDNGVAKTLADDKSSFLLNKQYEFKIRLTETMTGSFKDLMSIFVNPADGVEEKGYCKKIFNSTNFCHCENVDLPTKHEKEHFVIKVLIREQSQDCNLPWFVQSIHPIDFIAVDNFEYAVEKDAE